MYGGQTGIYVRTPAEMVEFTRNILINYELIGSAGRLSILEDSLKYLILWVFIFPNPVLEFQFQSRT